jgi:hypothetical protein
LAFVAVGVRYFPRPCEHQDLGFYSHSDLIFYTTHLTVTLRVNNDF